MKGFLIKAGLFFSPIFVLFAAAITIDPYNYFSQTNTVDPKLKHNIAYRLDYHLWKAIEYRRNPTPAIILGDSRAEAINAAEISKISGKKYFNFAYGGGTLSEIVETFWFASRLAKLEEVFIGINFNLYNENMLNRTREAAKAISSPFNYITNKSVLKSTGLIVYAELLEPDYKIGAPAMSKDEFWKLQLDITTRAIFEKYRFPKLLKKELIKIRKYCTANRIKLIFFIPPTHVDLENQIAVYGMTKYHEEFLSDLRQIGDQVINFDFPNDFTSDKGNFKDPYHAVSDSLVINYLWRSLPTNYARVER